MSRLFKNRQRRFLFLRYSTLQLATMLLTAMAVVVASLWFKQAELGWLVLLSSLLAGALVCVLLRVGPVMWRDMTRYRNLQQVSRMPVMHNHVAWRFNQAPQKLIEQSHKVLAGHRYSIKQTQHDGLTLLTAMRGRLNRLGFILVHAAALLILLGVLLDSDLWRGYQIRSGKLITETRSIPLNEMDVLSRIHARSAMAFQGNEQLLTGQMSDEVKVITPHGVLVKHLPFAVAINGVELDANQLLQENNFLTRIAILDPRLDEPVRAVLGSNRPFHYRGLDYYQQSVMDGGSELTVSMWPLAHAHSIPLKFRTQVGTERQLQTRQGTINILFSDLKPRNIMLRQSGNQTASEYKNIGPSLFYSVNDESGSEREFVNYMLPVLQDGRYFYISGARSHGDEPFHFMHLPVDREGSLNLFFELHAALYDKAGIDMAINKVLSAAGRADNTPERDEFENTLLDLIKLFREGGFHAVNENIASRVEPENYQQSMQLSHKLVRSLVYALFKEKITTHTMDETDVLFFEDALPVLARLAEVDMPFYIQLQDMVYKPMVNLLVSYKPGETLFFTGWLLLLSGLLCSFYTYHRRIWLVFKTEDDDTTVSIAGMGDRQGQRFAREFNRLFTQLQKTLSYAEH